MKKSKEFKLTNYQVPRSPEEEGYAALAKNAKPIDMAKYDNVGKVEEHETVDSVIEKMIQKREAATGQKVNAQPKESEKVNLGGIRDDRKDRKFFKLGK